MVKSCVVVGGGLLDYIVSYKGPVIVIVIGRPRSLTIIKTRPTVQLVCKAQIGER